MSVAVKLQRKLQWRGSAGCVYGRLLFEHVGNIWSLENNAKQTHQTETRDSVEKKKIGVKVR